MYTLNGVRPSLVTIFSCHIVAMLIPFHSTRLSGDHFETPIAPLQQLLPSIIINLLSLLTHLTAHSSSSGHTPPTLSPLFYSTSFGLEPAALPFHITYLEYLRATNAMKHVLLAFIRWQDAPSNELFSSLGGPGGAASLAYPHGLKTGFAVTHAPRTGHSIKETREASTLSWSPRRNPLTRRDPPWELGPHMRHASCM
jgi:hypothetical protein